jgi:probable HAF family extracellular repeat protein
MGAAINASGQVTGTTTPEYRSRAFLWDGTTMQDLGGLEGGQSVGEHINASGQVIGLAETRDGSLHAFLWDGSTMLDLGTFGGFYSQALALNDAGQVTGFAELPDSSVHAFFGTTPRCWTLARLGARPALATPSTPRGT